jgi:uncharacterized protein
MLINYIRKWLQAPVFIVFISLIPGFGVAGSYEDFFAAVSTDDVATVRNLLQRGFEPNTRDPKGQHLLHLAVRAPAPKIVDLMLSWPKVDVEARNPVDESPLMLAALEGKLDWVKKLVAQGGDVNKPGWAPLHYAATKGHIEIMDFLLEHHAYIDAESPNQTTPLMMAAMYGSPSAVKLLLEAGADPSIKNQLGLSAIDFALRAQRRESAEIIGAFLRAKGGGRW